MHFHCTIKIALSKIWPKDNELHVFNYLDNQ